MRSTTSLLKEKRISLSKKFESIEISSFCVSIQRRGNRDFCMVFVCIYLTYVFIFFISTVKKIELFQSSVLFPILSPTKYRFLTGIFFPSLPCSGSWRDIHQLYA
jgi:hypothetical protein